MYVNMFCRKIQVATPEEHGGFSCQTGLNNRGQPGYQPYAVEQGHVNGPH